MATEKKDKMADYEKLCGQMAQQGYHMKDATFSALKANLLALVTSGPLVLIFALIYYFRWEGGEDIFEVGAGGAFLILLLLSIPIHELIHGVTWALFCRGGFKSIEFGFIWKALTPYCHCKEPLNALAYALGGVMPGLLLGLLPCLVSLFIPSILWAFFGWLGLMGAGGDLAVLILLLQNRRGLLLDHPTLCGFVVFTKEAKAQ